MIRRIVPFIVVTLLGLAWLPLASAQALEAPAATPQSEQPPAMQPDQAVPQYSDEELRSFAAAALAVQQVKDTYGPMLAAATTAQEEQRVIRMAGAEMVRAVEQQGMSVDRFQEILESASGDSALVGRINRQLNGR